MIHVSDSPTIVLLWRHFPLLHFRAPEYETEERRGRATWWIERGLLVAKRGRGRGFLRLGVERLDRETAADTAAVLVRIEVRNFYPWLRGRGRFARFGAWLYSQTQLTNPHSRLQRVLALARADSSSGTASEMSPAVHTSVDIDASPQKVWTW